jgi:hypothetical protein
MNTVRLNGKSKFFNFINVQKTYTQDVRPKSNGKQGVYSKEEWLETRKGTTLFYDTPNVYNLRKLHWEKFDGINLAKLDPFLKDHLSLYRIGGGSSDEGVSTTEFDLSTDSLEIFAACDLLMMWGVDYALQDSDLIRLFNFSRDRKIPLLLSSMTPMSNLNRLVSWAKTNEKMRIFFRRKQISQSLVGYYRSRKYFEELAKTSSLISKEIFNNGMYSTFLIELP